MNSIVDVVHTKKLLVMKWDFEQGVILKGLKRDTFNVALGKFQKDELRVFLGIVANVIRVQLNTMNKCVVSKGIAMKPSTHFQTKIKFDSLKYHGIICDQVHSMCFHPFKFHKKCYSFNVGTFNFSTTKTTFKILHMSNEIKFINHTHSLIHKWDSNVTLLRTI